MLFKPEYDENGKKILCEINGVNSDMLMDIYVKKLSKGEVLEIFEEKMNVQCFFFQEGFILQLPLSMRNVHAKIRLRKSLMPFIFQKRLRLL